METAPYLGLLIVMGWLYTFIMAKTIEKKAKNGQAWERSYAYAKRKYGAGQYLLDVPAKKGKMSFSYTNNKGQFIRVYY